MQTLLKQHWHHLPADEAVQLLGSHGLTGLSLFEAKHRLERFGPNDIIHKKPDNPLIQFLSQFHQPLIYVLLASSVVTGFAKAWVDAAVILFVVMANSVIGFIQERKAGKAVDSLRHLVTTDATIVRDGRQLRLPSQEIVPGDVVLLQSGDKVPADLRLVSCRDLQIDESPLTGETVPILKETAVLPQDTILADRINMAFAGTLVTYGQGQGVVVGTGSATQSGQIAELVSQAPDLETALTKKLKKFSKNVLWAILGMATLTFVWGFFTHDSPLHVFLASVALAVSMIPEGLPAVVTITLAIGVKRMAARGAIIRKLPAVETLGSTTVICSDKTGTLTQNQMTVKKIWAGQGMFDVSGVGYSSEGQIEMDGGVFELKNSKALSECLLAGLLCNDSRVGDEKGNPAIVGDPTEAALIICARKASLTEDSAKKDFPRKDVIPFESDRQYMATLHEPAEALNKVVFMKGAVEKILERCEFELGADAGLLNFNREKIEQQAAQLAQEGFRVLAFCKKIVPLDHTSLRHEDLSSGLIFLGLQAMIDPPRPEAIAAIKACQGAGIQVKMITGDHVLTATAIAEQLGLIQRGPGALQDQALTGKQLAALSDAQLMEKIKTVNVFARVEPAQKLRLVDAFQAQGHVVAMTGDGVNDAPALKSADIGIAMGRSGTDVAREASDMILTDDNFATIGAAVEEGRSVLNNLINFLIWTLPTNMGQGLILMVAILAQMELPVLPVQILWVNLTTALFLGLTLAFEPSEEGLMKKVPRQPNEPIMSKALLLRSVVVSFIMVAGGTALFVWLLKQGEPIEEARTAVVNLVVMVQTFYLFNCRSLRKSPFQLGFFSNRWLILGVLAMVGLQILFTYHPYMEAFFHTRPFGWTIWGYVVGLSLATYFIIDIGKRVTNNHK